MNPLSLTQSKMNKLIPAIDTANILGITPETLSVWRSSGRYNLPFVKIGSRVMYRQEDIQSFIDNRTMIHTT